MKKNFRFIVAVILSVSLVTLLSACHPGKGGDDDNADKNRTTIPVATETYVTETETGAEDTTAPDGTRLLFDYVCKTMTADGDNNYELYLYCTDEGDILLRVTDEENGEKTTAEYDAPASIYNEALNYALSYGMPDWSTDNGVPLDGAWYSCRFLSTEGEYCFVTSDMMPENGGMAAFNTIRNLLESCITVTEDTTEEVAMG